MAAVASRVALRACGAWLSLFARRLRHSLLQARSVALSDRRFALALLHAPSLAAQLAALASLPAERAAGVLNSIEVPQRAALLEALDAAALGAQLANGRPKAAAAALARLALRARAAVLAAMPRVAAAAAVRAMGAPLRDETLLALPVEARVSITGSEAL